MMKTDSDKSETVAEAKSEATLAAPHGSAARWSVKPLFAWYDCWVGIFWDSRKRKLYILPLPCVGVVIKFPMRHNVELTDAGPVTPASGETQSRHSVQ